MPSLPGFLLLLAAGTLAFLFLAGILFTWILQHHFLLRPSRMPAGTSLQFDSPFEELFFTINEKTKIHSIRFRATYPPRGVVLYFHGNSGDLRNWGKLHEAFTSLGYDFFVFDYPSFGISTGNFNEKLIYRIAATLYDFLAKEYPPDRIVIYGRSIGTGPAAWLASQRPCHSLILEAPYSSIPDLFYTYYPFLPRIFFFRIRFPNKAVLPEVISPVLIFQGDKDLVVPIRCAKKLLPFLKGKDRFIQIQGGGHRNLGDCDEYVANLSLWLNG